MSIQETVLDTLADDVLAMLKQPLKMVGEEDFEFPADRGIVGGSCWHKQCLAPKSAFYLNSRTNQFACAKCANEINANAPMTFRKYFAPIEMYTDGSLYVTSYSKYTNSVVMREYFIDTSHTSVGTDNFLLVYVGSEPKADGSNLLQPSEYEEFSQYLLSQMVLYVNYVDESELTKLNHVLNLCESTLATIALLDQSSLPQC